MAFFVYVTEKCHQDADEHGCKKDLLKFRDEVEQDERTNRFDPFPPPYLIKDNLQDDKTIDCRKKKMQ